MNIDIDRFLFPISEDAPAGESLRYEGTYDRIREARREDDPSLPQGVWEKKLKTADWKTVVRLCEDALERRSKDLQVAVWLAEAWLQQGGFAGVAPGVGLITALSKRFWSEMYPQLSDDGDIEPRANLIEWLDENFSQKLRVLSFSGEPSGYNLLDWERGSTGGEPRENASRSDDEGASGDDVFAHVSLIGRARWLELHRNTSEALAAVLALEDLLRELTPSAPTLRRVRETLRSIVRITEESLRLTGGAPSAPVEDPAAELAPEMSGTGAKDELPRSASGAIRSRADAYFRLSEAAEYLLRTEPHSPVPYLVKRAVSWGNMSLAELLNEFIASPDDLVTIQRLLGMRSRDE